MKKILLKTMRLAMVLALVTVVTTVTSVLAGTTLTAATTTPITYEEKAPEFQKGFAYLKMKLSKNLYWFKPSQHRGETRQVITKRSIQNLMFVPNNILFIDPKDQNKIILVNT